MIRPSERWAPFIVSLLGGGLLLVLLAPILGLAQSDFTPPKLTNIMNFGESRNPKVPGCSMKTARFCRGAITPQCGREWSRPKPLETTSGTPGAQRLPRGEEGYGVEIARSDSAVMPPGLRPALRCRDHGTETLCSPVDNLDTLVHRSACRSVRSTG